MKLWLCIIIIVNFSYSYDFGSKLRKIYSLSKKVSAEDKKIARGFVGQLIKSRTATPEIKKDTIIQEKVKLVHPDTLIKTVYHPMKTKSYIGKYISIKDYDEDMDKLEDKIRNIAWAQERIMELIAKQNENQDKQGEKQDFILKLVEGLGGILASLAIIFGGAKAAKKYVSKK